MSAAYVLDASALLAALHQESGGDTVRSVIPQSAISSVNWAEVIQRSIARGANPQGMREDLEALGLALVPFTAVDADLTGTLWQQTRHLGLSLGDRACLALGLRLGVPVLTADRVWQDLSIGVAIQVLR